MRRQNTAEVRQRVSAPALNGNAKDPLVMVYDAQGTLVMSRRLGAKSANGTAMLDSIPFPAERIATVDVIKSGSLLPREASGGLVRIVLRPETGTQMKQAAPDSSDDGSLRVRRSTPAESGAVTVIVLANDGKELYRGFLAGRDSSAKGDAFSQVPVDRDAIATVNVVKTPAGVEPAAKRSSSRSSLEWGFGRSTERVAARRGRSLRRCG